MINTTTRGNRGNSSWRETAINAVYRQANERDIGGTLEALAFAFLNVAVATLCGGASNEKPYPRNDSYLGMGDFDRFPIFTLFYNLGVGHYRSALASTLTIQTPYLAEPHILADHQKPSASAIPARLH